MRSLEDAVKEHDTVAAEIEELLKSKDEADGDAERLVELDDRAEAIKAEIEEINKRDEIAARNAARRDSLKQPVKKTVVKRDDVAVSSNVHPRVADDPEGGFRSYGEFLASVKEACRQGGTVDENLLAINAAYGNNTSEGADGGFLIPPEYSNMIVERVAGELPLMEKADKLTLKGNSVTVTGMADHDRSDTAYRNAGVVTYWVGEGKEITKSDMQFRQITLRLNKLASLSYVTEEELADVSNFGSRLFEKHARGIREEIAEAMFFGSGSGQPLGAFTGTSPCVQVAKEDSQTADTIVYENIMKMWSVIDDASRGRGEWYYNGECLPQLSAMSLAVGTGGGPVYMPAGGISAAPYSTLYGRPAYTTDHCEALGDAGDIVFADWSQYLLAMKGTVNTAMSIHLRFDYDETAFKSTFRVDGRPAWDRNLKPRKGDSARRVSPFVKLAARA